MFKRRQPLTKLQLLKEMFWPTMGWRRMAKFLTYRILRLSDSTHKIARGLACGASISFSPLVGTHFIQAGFISYLIRGNILGSLIGTFVGNPWTFPFMWYASYELGVRIFGIMGFQDLGEMPDHITFSLMWDMVRADPMKLFLPWLIGGYILAILFWPVYFVIFFYLVRAGKKAKMIAKEKRLKRKTLKEFEKA
ncbi:MAG: DUF2062 domain-containing protein [Rhodospirillales bacterium]|nr:DUF2062 domain-containing protein [Rhodospirillales bacterium]MCB9964588.1 DUF2062 domain-containing protein [Rhodospirillales bacterium]MCB9973889.1 DUF2062 domain-containing protein [Rhodospirillales bacterium]MCB9980514.1 DUF2062 domain-containing protein [Rhodospirillales bacterium]